MSDEEDEKGTYYTPLHLVNLVMDEVYPWEGEYKDISFFDPSCGSGIFLVEAYRRLVCRWMSQNAVQAITCDRLNLLLKNSIFGVDINEEAIRVASFSLSLAMCDFLDQMCIRDRTIGVSISPFLLAILPYALTLIAMLGAAGKNSEPEALAKPYVKGSR